MALEIARQSVGGTGKAIRTWAIARYYVDVRDVSSIILIAEITAASTAPTALSPYLSPLLPCQHISRRTTPDFLICIFTLSFVINVYIYILVNALDIFFHGDLIRDHISQKTKNEIHQRMIQRDLMKVKSAMNNMSSMLL